jgi:hypothetical protein
MIAVTLFQCEICNALFKNEKGAKKCEASKAPKVRPEIGSEWNFPEVGGAAPAKITRVWLGNVATIGDAKPGHKVMVESHYAINQYQDSDDIYESTFAFEDLTPIEPPKSIRKKKKEKPVVSPLQEAGLDLEAGMAEGKDIRTIVLEFLKKGIAESR